MSTRFGIRVRPVRRKSFAIAGPAVEDAAAGVHMDCAGALTAAAEEEKEWEAAAISSAPPSTMYLCTGRDCA